MEMHTSWSPSTYSSVIYIDPAYREQAMHLKVDPATGKKQFLADQKPMKIFEVEAFLGG
jgi:hypothetical protein